MGSMVVNVGVMLPLGARWMVGISLIGFLRPTLTFHLIVYWFRRNERHVPGGFFVQPI